ncbi:MAG: hypothetical protein RBQ78_07270 [Acholeplasmataceae bacterium]|jgi:hypothetical protein|nr:hypothetical protein [Acholeplasmataceae bacterium]
MNEFIRKWSNWWILNPKRKQLDDAFEKELNELIERKVALRIHDVVGRSEQLKAFLRWAENEWMETPPERQWEQMFDEYFKSL